MRWLRIFCIIVFLLCGTGVSAQCTIQAKRVACVNDLVNFSINNSSGTVTSYYWTFGTATSSNTSPTTKFNTASTVLVSCTLTLAGGGQCIDTHSIEILPNPKAISAVEDNPDTCSKSNRICMKNLFQKGARGLYSLSLLWGDGNIDNYKSPLGNNWCHHYTDSGSFTMSFELADSAGCKDVLKITVRIAPSPDAKTTPSVTFQCDSSKICFPSSVSGGKSWSYKWTEPPATKVLGTKSTFCTTKYRGQYANVQCIVTNNYGCTDTIYASEMAPDSGITFGFAKSRLCSSQLASGLSINLGELVTWEFNGKNLGTASFMTLYNAKPGWNYLKLTTNNPCPWTRIDSFYMSDIRIKARAFNEFRRTQQDTAWFIDLSKNDPKSRIRRLWNFGDASATQCTTWLKKNQFVLSNCNFSKDSLAWHNYGNKACPYIRFTLYDSTTDCEIDTVMQIYRTDFCTDFIQKKQICLGEFEYFNISKGLKEKIGSRNFVITDINNPPGDTLKFTGTSLLYKYKTAGLKSPVFWRFYDDDTVWTEREGKIVVDFIRPGRGWVADTFRNYIKVIYKPEAQFTIKSIGTCNPSKAQITFKDSVWLYPKKMEVSWGDTIISYSGYTDTIAKLPVLTHVYKTAGHYFVVVTLYSNTQCVGAFSAEISFGNYTNLRVFPSCTNTLCFSDTVTDGDGKSNRWTGTNKLGKLLWDFGDGMKDSGFNKCHAFANYGTFTVKMTAVSKYGCSTVFTKEVVLAKAFAAIKHQPQLYCSEIRQYFDSSYTKGNPDSAKVVKWNWNFGDGTNPVFVQNPAHIYPAGGVYTVRLIITTNRGCRDTAYKTFTVLGPQVKAKILNDSIGCTPLHVIFGNLSKNAGNFIWEYGDPDNTFYSTQKDTNVAFTYKKPGTYYVHLTGGDSFTNPTTGSTYYCSITYPNSGQNQLRIRVMPGFHSEFSAPDTLCTGDSLLFDNTSDTSNPFNYVWNMGDGNTFTRKNVDFSYTYKEPGTYAVSLHADAPPGAPCLDTARQNITVFKFTPSFERDCAKSKAPILYFKNTSGPDIDNYKWTFLNTQDSTESLIAYSRHLYHDFGFDTGTKVICLRLNIPNVCKEKTCKSIVLKGGIYLANVFTPGTDGYNDRYRMPLYGFEKYDLRIFNRWGELLFHSEDPSYEWNGRVNNTGTELPASTYFYQLRYQDYCDKKVKMVTGSITLIRN